MNYGMPLLSIASASLLRGASLLSESASWNVFETALTYADKRGCESPVFNDARWFGVGRSRMDDVGASEAGFWAEAQLPFVHADSYSPVGSGSWRRTSSEELQREVYCVLGVPVDLTSLPSLADDIDQARLNHGRLFISTPNLNFMTLSWTDARFRQSLLNSDLCLPDGAPVIWISRLLGLPIKERIAGSDILSALRDRNRSHGSVKIFFFGGDAGVAEEAARALNNSDGGAHCVGWLYPGFGSIEDMSSDETIDAINDSGADFLVVALGAQKGQAWLMRNAARLQIPVRAHLGASLNFEAGRLARAPRFLQRMGLEWLWRIKEEPYLWRRYFRDGVALLRALAGSVAPLIVHDRLKASEAGKRLEVVKRTSPSGDVTIALSGPATVRRIGGLVSEFGEALDAVGKVTIDLSRVSVIDPRFLGLMIVFRRKVEEANRDLVICGVSKRMKRQFQRHKSMFLLDPVEGDARRPVMQRPNRLDARALSETSVS